MKLGAHFILITLGYISIFYNMKTTFATRNSDAVMLKFQFVSPSDWTPGVVLQLKASLAEYANSYCARNLTICGMRIFRSISESDILIMSGYPKEELIHTVVSLCVRLSPSRTLPKPALTGILLNNHIKLHEDLLQAAGSAISDSWAFRVAHVDGKSVLPSRERVEFLNMIVTPIVCGLILVLLLVVGILECSSRLNQKRLLMRCIAEKVAAQQANGSSPPSFAAVVVSNDLRATTA